MKTPKVLFKVELVGHYEFTGDLKEWDLGPYDKNGIDCLFPSPWEFDPICYRRPICVPLSNDEKRQCFLRWGIPVSYSDLHVRITRRKL